MNKEKQKLTILLGNPEDRLKLAIKSRDSQILKDLFVHTLKVFNPSKEEQESFAIFEALNKNPALPSECLEETLKLYLKEFKGKRNCPTQNVIKYTLSNPNISSFKVLESFYKEMPKLISKKLDDYESQTYEYNIIAAILKSPKVEQSFISKMSTKYLSHIGHSGADALMFVLLAKTKSKAFLRKYFEKEYYGQVNTGKTIFGMVLNPLTEGHVLHLIVEEVMQGGNNLNSNPISLKDIINHENIGVNTLNLLIQKFPFYKQEIDQRILELTTDEEMV